MWCCAWTATIVKYEMMISNSLSLRCVSWLENCADISTYQSYITTRAITDISTVRLISHTTNLWHYMKGGRGYE